MRKNTLVATLIVGFVLSVVACSDSTNSPTAPSTTSPSPPVSVAVDYFTPNAGVVLTSGMTGTFVSSTSGGVMGQTSTHVMGWIRNDGFLRLDSCSGWNNTGSGTTYAYLELNSSDPKGEYAFAKGHVINAVTLVILGGTPPECLSGSDSNPRSIFDKAAVRKDVALNWRVE